MEKLMAFLGAQPEVAPSYESMISQRDPELLPEVKRHQEEMMRPFEPYLAMRGYK